MTDVTGEFEREYREACHAFLAQGGEAALEHAYELGRRGMAQGLGLPGIAALYRRLLTDALIDARDEAEASRTAARVSLFFSETLSAYELTFQGFRDAVEQLRDLNRTLERRVAERTREAERARDEAITANRAKSEFLAVISHELGTPLNAIIGYADLLLMGAPESLPETAGEQVKRIDANARHLVEMVSTVLNFARVEADSEQVRVEQVDLGELTHHCAALIEPLAREKGLRLRIRAPASPAPIHTDPGKVRQILLNLLSNAVKFTDHGHISLCARVSGGRALVEVRDTGIGIEPKHREQIFEPFWQVEPATTRRSPGTGLGLSVSRQLARLLGGDVTLAPARRKGTRFRVNMPVHAGRKRPAEKPSPSPKEVGSGPLERPS